jgi:hypothetical protein
VLVGFDGQQDNFNACGGCQFLLITCKEQYFALLPV